MSNPKQSMGHGRGGPGKVWQVQRHGTTRETISMGVSSRSGRRKRFGEGMACFLKVRDGTPVFIVVRCIAATRAAGTVYEQINQSMSNP
jgi:hypothetical protein